MSLHVVEVVIVTPKLMAKMRLRTKHRIAALAIKKLRLNILVTR